MNRKFQKYLENTGVIVVAVVIVLLIGWYTSSIWEECRATNSTMYCLHVLSR